MCPGIFCSVANGRANWRQIIHSARLEKSNLIYDSAKGQLWMECCVCVCVWAEECAREGARRWVVESGATSSSRATISFQVASTHKHLRRKCFQQDFFCQRIYCNCLFLYFVYMHCISFPPLHNITTQPSATNTPSTERSTYVFLAPALALVVCCNCENVNKYKTV